jgi:type II secretory pathway pseudopilin PulG
MKNLEEKQSGFTLLEVVIVIVSIVILVAVLLFLR